MNTSIRVNSTTGTTASLTLVYGVDTTSYSIQWYRSTASGETGDQVFSTTSSFDFEDTGLTPGVTYFYEAYLVDNDNFDEGMSPQISVTPRPLTLFQTVTAVVPGNTADFYAQYGTEPYTYLVVPGGAGGVIDDDGLYTAPTGIGEFTAATGTDTVQVVDADFQRATAKITVGSPLFLVCDIIQRELGLSDGRVYLWNQKLMQPTDSGLYVAIGVLESRVIGNVNRHSPTDDGLTSGQSLTVRGLLSIDIISRGPAARDRKEDVLLALASDYSQRQQTANSFHVARTPSGAFLNLSEGDGAAIPYRFRVNVAIQYGYQKATSADYFDTFASPTVTPNS